MAKTKIKINLSQDVASLLLEDAHVGQMIRNMPRGSILQRNAGTGKFNFLPDLNAKTGSYETAKEALEASAVTP